MKTVIKATKSQSLCTKHKTAKYMQWTQQMPNLIHQVWKNQLNERGG